MPANTVYKIDLEPVGQNQWRGYYQAELIATGNSVELAVCRALNDRGLSGVIETWHRGAAYPSMRIDIATGAQLAVSETNGPRFVKYRPFPTDERLPVNRTTTQTEIVAGGIHPSG